MMDFKQKFGVNYIDSISDEKAIYKGTKYRITILSDLLIRLEYSETGLFEDRPTEFARFRKFAPVNVEIDDTEKILKLKTKYFELSYEKEKPFVGSKLSPDQYLKVTLNDTDKIWYFNHPEARNFKSTASNLDDINKMPKLEKGLYSTDGFVSIDDSKSLIFGEDGSVGKRKDLRIDTYLFMYKKDFGFALRDYYKLTGYPPLIPRYALGVWWDKDETYSNKDLEQLIDKFKRNDIPISTILLNNWSIDGVNPNIELYESFNTTLKMLQAHGIHTGLDINIDKVNIGGEIKDFNVFDKEFVQKYLESLDILDKIDLVGIDYKNNDLYSLRMLNYYFYNYMNNLNRRGLILSRNGLVNSHLYPVHNSGETLVSWDLLKMLPEFSSSSSNIGSAWWSHAIGGYKGGIEDADLYTRFIQYGTFSPIFRFASRGGKYYKREPWNWEVKTTTIASYYTTLRHRLIPYLYSEAYKYHRTGLPLNQPLYYRYAELYDEPLYKNEYFFGTEFFIVPITDRKDEIMNRTVTKMFLPNGVWYDFKTGKKFPGGKRYISFFKDEDYPVFVKQGGIIPLADLGDNLNNTGNPDKFEIHIFPGKNNTFKLYEDDGYTNQYKENNFLTTQIEYNYLPNNYTVIIRPLEGKTDVVPRMRKYKIRFRNTKKADDVIAYLGANLIEVKSYLDDQDFIVETDYINSSEQLSINCKGKDIEIDAVRLINEDIDTIISDLKINTVLKEKIADIIFSEDDIKKKRIEIRKLKDKGLDPVFIKMFLKLLEYISQI